MLGRAVVILWKPTMIELSKRIHRYGGTEARGAREYTRAWPMTIKNPPEMVSLAAFAPNRYKTRQTKEVV
jgi:hypothetical protein